jgi:hypothetical protein
MRLELLKSLWQKSMTKRYLSSIVGRIFFQVKLGYDVLQEQERVLTNKDTELEGVRQELKKQVNFILVILGVRE